MTRKALARRIAEVLFNEPATRRGAGAAPTRRAAWILAGCFVARRSKTTAGMLPPRAAHPAKIRSSAAIRASDLAHECLRLRFRFATALPRVLRRRFFLQLGFDLLMQVFGEFPVRQSIDHFVEKAACDEALSCEVIDAAALKIKQLFRFHLPGSCPVCTTHIIRQNLKTGHRIRLSFVTQQ